MDGPITPAGFRACWTTAVTLLGSLQLLSCSGCQESAEVLVDVAEATQLVVVTIGDSYASGEGNPDVPDSNGNPTWSDGGPDQLHSRACHRSQRNAHRIAVDAISSEWPHGSDRIAYRNFACTGASTGSMTSAQSPPASDDEIPAQLDQVEEWLDEVGRDVFRIDVLIVQVGGNDAGFARVIEHCTAPPSIIECYQKPELTNAVQSGLAALPSRLRTLESRIRERLNPKQVLLVRYPNSVRNQDGQLCDRFPEPFAVGPDLLAYLGGSIEIVPFVPLVGASMFELTRNETDWIEGSFLNPLNEALFETARCLDDWQVADARGFDGHGYCSDDRFVNTYADSFEKIGQVWGIFHPNTAGHTAIAAGIAYKLRLMLGLSTEPDCSSIPPPEECLLLTNHLIDHDSSCGSN